MTVTDVRSGPAPSTPLVLCRNAAFTYLDEGRQRDVLRTIVKSRVYRRRREKP